MSDTELERLAHNAVEKDRLREAGLPVKTTRRQDVQAVLEQDQAVRELRKRGALLRCARS